MLWRKAISLIVLIAFSSSLLAPAFASTEPLPNSKEFLSKAKQTQNADVKSALKTLKKSKLSNSQETTISDNNNSSLSISNKFLSFENKYLPYFELGGNKNFNQDSGAAAIYDLFIPLFQNDQRMLFADLRVFDRTGSSAEGNLHLGYRHLFPESKQMFGVYGAFDVKRSEARNIYNQLTLGFEYWRNQLFVGGNIYKPIGKTSNFVEKDISEKSLATGRSIIRDAGSFREKALPGADAELGYAITDNLTSYAGGYYFAASDADKIAGPKIRLTYDYAKPNGKILGILDRVSIEAGAGHDKVRGNTAYLGIKFKVGLNSSQGNSNLEGFERHMTELVRRDPDIIVGKIALSKDQGYFYSTDNEEDFSQRTTEELLEEFGLQKTPSSKSELNKHFNKDFPSNEKVERQQRYTCIFKILRQRIFSNNKSKNPLSHTANKTHNLDRPYKAIASQAKPSSTGNYNEITIYKRTKNINAANIDNTTKLYSSNYKISQPKTNNILTRISKSIYTRPKSALAAAITTLSSGWIATKYFLASSSKGVSNSKQNKITPRSIKENHRNKLFSKIGLPFKKSNNDGWKNILSTLPLFFTMNSGGMSIPFFVPLRGADEQSKQRTIESFVSASSLIDRYTIDDTDEIDTSLAENYARLIHSKNNKESKNKSEDENDINNQNLELLQPLLKLPDWNYNPSTKETSESENRVKKKSLPEVAENAIQKQADAASIKNTPDETTVNLSYEYEDNDIENILELRAQELGLDVRDETTVILSPLDFRGDQLREQLQEERRNRSENQGFARTILVPLHVLHLQLDHWAGLVIRLDNNNQVTDIQYTDSLDDKIPYNVEQTLRDVYGNNIYIRTTSGLRQTDGMSCGPLAIENLLNIALNQPSSHAATARETREIRARHIELLERYRSELQFSFRQRRNIRSFEYQTPSGSMLQGGFCPTLPLFYHLASEIPNLRIATYGGMQAFDEISPIRINDPEPEEANIEEIAPIEEAKNDSNIKRLKDVFKYGVFFFSASAVLAIANFASSLMLSKLGFVELSASSLISALQSMLLNIATNTITVVDVFTSGAYAQKNYLDIGLSLRQSWFQAIILSNIFMPVAIFSGLIMRAIGQDHLISNIVQNYFFGYFWGLPALYMTFSNTIGLMGMNHKTHLLGTFLIQKLITFGLAYPLMFPLKLGSLGLGLANSTANWIAFLLSTVYLDLVDFHSGYKYKFFRFTESRRERIARLAELFKIGLPTGIRTIIESTVAQLCVSMAGNLGKPALAGTGVTLTYLTLAVLPGAALGQSIPILVRNNIAKKNFKGIRNLVVITSAASLALSATTLGIFFIFSHPLISVFIHGDGPDQRSAISTARIAMLITGGGALECLRSVILGTLKGFKDTWSPLWVSLFLFAPTTLISAKLFSSTFGFGAPGIFIGIDIGMFTMSAALVGRMIYRIESAVRNNEVREPTGIWELTKASCRGVWRGLTRILHKLSSR